MKARRKQVAKMRYLRNKALNILSPQDKQQPIETPLGNSNNEENINP